MKQFPRLATTLLAFLLLTASTPQQASESASSVNDLARSLGGKRLLFLGAHPDDEWVLMPILAEACVFNGAVCHFVNTTHSELGCYGPIREPDLDVCAERRRNELARSAKLANGTVEYLGWKDVFYAHDAAGLRRNLQRWEAIHGGREALVETIVDVLRRSRPDVVFTLDPRHGATCHPNHRATSILLVEALARLPEAQRPRVLLENVFAVPEGMSEEMIASTERGAMYPWPDIDDPVLYYDATQVLPNGRRAIEYQVDAMRAHSSQFPGLPDDLEVDVETDHLKIPLIDLADIDPTEDLCAAFDLSHFKTFDVTLDFLGRQMQALAAGLSSRPEFESDIAFQVLVDGELVVEYGSLDEQGQRAEADFPRRRVRMIVGAQTTAAAQAALEAQLRLLSRFAEAPE